VLCTYKPNDLSEIYKTFNVMDKTGLRNPGLVLRTTLLEGGFLVKPPKPAPSPSPSGHVRRQPTQDELDLIRGDVMGFVPRRKLTDDELDLIGAPQET
jgi:hypothetical protein